MERSPAPALATQAGERSPAEGRPPAAWGRRAGREAGRVAALLGRRWSQPSSLAARSDGRIPRRSCQATVRMVGLHPTSVCDPGLPQPRRGSIARPPQRSIGMWSS